MALEAIQVAARVELSLTRIDGIILLSFNNTMTSGYDWAYTLLLLDLRILERLSWICCYRNKYRQIANDGLAYCGRL